MTQSTQTVSTKLARIGEQSKREPGTVFTALAHHMDEVFLKEAFNRLRKNAAAGIDRITATDYAKDLEGNLKKLHQRLVDRQYRAQPARRVWIPKADGSQRGLAILILEDKIVQKAVAMLLEAVYEPHFHDFSQGFRPGRGAHGALKQLHQHCLNQGVNWIVDADIAKFFDEIDHTHLREILQRRVNDGALLRLIGMWLHVGVLEEGQVTRNEEGTPQGGVISPILANIFLHTVLDEWMVKEMQPRLAGPSFLVRYADDFVMGFVQKPDAQAVYENLPKRFEQYGLRIHPDKSRMVAFSRPFGGTGKGPGTFTFLGFSHYWAKTLKGGWMIKRKTDGKRLRRFMSGIEEWCRKNCHESVTKQYRILTSKLRGHYQYYGVRGNYKMMEVACEHTDRVWRKWLSRRSSKSSLNWTNWANQMQEYFGLPKPKIIHAF